MANNYEVGRFLGKGSFATVRLARNIHTKQSFAIKIIDVTSCQQKQNNNGGVVDEPYTIAVLLQREIDVHMSVSSSRHPNIVSLIESFEYNNEITGNEMKALVLDYCCLGDLQSYMKRVRDERKRQQYDEGTRGKTLLLPEGTFLSVNQIRHTVSQVLCGLSFLHARGICHRDLKAPNIFLCPIQTSSVDNNTLKKKGNQILQFSLLDCQIKLGDFGLAVQMEDDDDWNEVQRTFCGTPSCIAPEVVSQSNCNIPVSASVGGKSSRMSNDYNDEFDSLVGTDASLFARQSELGKKACGYGQPADLWSTGCLLYTMIAGRNPFAAATHAQTTPQNHDSEMQQIEKTKRIRQIIQRVIQGNWSLPANVKITKSMEILLDQLLQSCPRKRGSARGILNMHPFFQTAKSASPTKQEDECGMINKENEINLKDWEYQLGNDMDSYLFRSDSSEEVEKYDFSGRNSTTCEVGDPVSATTDEAKEGNKEQVPSDMFTEKCDALKLANNKSASDDVSLTETLPIEMDYVSQSITNLKKYQQAAAESSSLVSAWSLSSSILMEEKTGTQNDEVSSIRRSRGGRITLKSSEHPKPDISSSLKSLHRLQRAKYSWEEHDSIFTVFLLGKEGLVIQRETMGNNDDLWMHVIDENGVLWGTLKPKSSCSIQLGSTPNDDELLLQAYSRAPVEFSKQALTSLLSLKRKDIISLYESLECRVEHVKSNTPKVSVVLYKSNDNAGISSQQQNEMFAETMLMENETPDIESRFFDGTVIRLSTADMNITVRGEHGITEFDVDPKKIIHIMKADRSTSSTPSNEMFLHGNEPLPKFVNYLCVFMESSRECCLLLDENLDSSAYPRVIKIGMHGWHRDDWTKIDDDK